MTHYYFPGFYGIFYRAAFRGNEVEKLTETNF